MEEWITIPGFPNYAVSNMGRVQNTATGKILAIRVTQQGHRFVGMNAGAIQCQRSVAKLVGDAFVDKLREDFDYPIHLDGDLSDNRASNLMWRPHWFGVRYMKQMKRGQVFKEANPIVDLHTGETYQTPWMASMVNGLIESEILLAIANRTYVFPTFQEFRFVAQ